MPRFVLDRSRGNCSVLEVAEMLDTRVYRNALGADHDFFINWHAQQAIVHIKHEILCAWRDRLRALPPTKPFDHVERLSDAITRLKTMEDELYMAEIDAPRSRRRPFERRRKIIDARIRRLMAARREAKRERRAALVPA